jgi:hypothetical protein
MIFCESSAPSASFCTRPFLWPHWKHKEREATSWPFLLQRRAGRDRVIFFWDGAGKLPSNYKTIFAMLTCLGVLAIIDEFQDQPAVARDFKVSSNRCGGLLSMGKIALIACP